MRIVDTTEYMQRTRSRNYDAIASFLIAQSLSPGQELSQYFGSENADKQGSVNYMGIKSPVVDALINKVVFAPDRKTKVAAVRALDRVLTWSFYSIPLYYAPDYMIAYWDRFGHTDIKPNWAQNFLYFDTWWIDKEKDEVIKKARGGN